MTQAVTQPEITQHTSHRESVLYYIHDPMCSWCWGFKPVLRQLTQQLPTDVRLEYVLGGLAADTDQPMPAEMQQQIAATWKHIQQVIPGTEFNFDFWTKCQPRRSTYIACRAVIVAEQLEPGNGLAMLDAILQAYYLQAKNPSDAATLITLAEQLGLDVDRFDQLLNAAQTQQALQQQIDFARRIGANSFPSLYLLHRQHYHSIVLDYNHADVSLEHINSVHATVE
jgi:putative protein-disulfide isomerase